MIAISSFILHGVVAVASWQEIPGVLLLVWENEFCSSVFVLWKVDCHLIFGWETLVLLLLLSG